VHGRLKGRAAAGFGCVPAGGFHQAFGQLVEIDQCGLRELDLLAAGILGIAQGDPAFLAHGFEACVQRGGRAEFLDGHHVPHAKALAAVPRARDQGEDALFQWVECRQRGQAAQRLRELQEAKVDVCWAGQSLVLIGNRHCKLLGACRTHVDASCAGRPPDPARARRSCLQCLDARRHRHACRIPRPPTIDSAMRQAQPSNRWHRGCTLPAACAPCGSRVSARLSGLLADSRVRDACQWRRPLQCLCGRRPAGSRAGTGASAGSAGLRFPYGLSSTLAQT